MTDPNRRLLILAYEGTRYAGWQSQPGLETVQATVTAAAEAVVGGPVRLQAASRTDAGVHAAAQWVLLRGDLPPWPPRRLKGRLNAVLPDDIVVRRVEPVPRGFRLVDVVRAKVYRYRVALGPVRPWAAARLCWYYGGPLNREVMQRALPKLEGRHDFRAFASRVRPGQSTVRTLFGCRVLPYRCEDHAGLEFRLSGDGFLTHMVRRIVGTCVDIGRGHGTEDTLRDVLESRDPRRAGHLAPARGLCLWRTLDRAPRGPEDWGSDRVALDGPEGSVRVDRTDSGGQS